MGSRNPWNLCKRIPCPALACACIPRAVQKVGKVNIKGPKECRVTSLQNSPTMQCNMLKTKGSRGAAFSMDMKWYYSEHTHNFCINVFRVHVLNQFQRINLSILDASEREGPRKKRFLIFIYFVLFLCLKVGKEKNDILGWPLKVPSQPEKPIQPFARLKLHIHI